MKKVNQDIRETIKKAGVYQYQVADQIGISEVTLIRWLRYELTDEKRSQIASAIKNLSK